MQIVELNEKQFSNYAKIHSKRNIYQSVEYAHMQKEHGFNPLFLGFMDDYDNVVAAALILEANINKNFKYGIVPAGYLIDFKNLKLLEEVTNTLKEELAKRGFIYIRVNPLVDYEKYNNKGKLIRDNTNLIDKYKKMGYYYLGFDDNRFNSNVILYTKDNVENTFKSFKRMTRRKINSAMHMGINVYKGSPSDLQLFYDMVKDREKRGIDYYREYLKFFNSNNMKMELYFAKIDPQIYINNYRYLMKKEQDNNEKLAIKIKSPKVKKTNSLINRKMLSDRMIIRYNDEIKKAMEIYKLYPKGMIIGTCAVISNNKEVFIMNTGYEAKVKEIYSTELIIWEVIKKYMNDGYKIFNLGQVSNNLSKKSKYYGLYYLKIGFNGETITYPGEFDLVINKFLYPIFKKK